MQALTVVTALALVLFCGVIISWIAQKLRIPDMLLLLLAGLVVGQLTINGQPVMEIPPLLLSSIAIIALALIVFDSTARLRIKELDNFSTKALKVTLLSVAFILIFFTATAMTFLQISVFSSLLLAALLTETSAEAILTNLGKSRIGNILKLESIFNTPLAVILPFIVLDLAKAASFWQQIPAFLTSIIVGIGSGVFVGVVLFKIVHKTSTKIYSPLAVIIAALISYVLAENLGGSGVLAASALGIFFGNAYSQHRFTLLGAESVLAKALYILVFILTGAAIKIPLNLEFLMISGFLFLAYTAIRFGALWVALGSEQHVSDIAFMALIAPKGVATVVVAFSLLAMQIQGVTFILEIIFAFIVYSIIVSSITKLAVPVHLRNSHTVLHNN